MNKTIQSQLLELASIDKVIEQVSFKSKKSLGQNFLTDTGITCDIANHLRFIKSSNVIEIGPGPGALTRSLFYCGAQQVWAIDMDSRAKESLGPLQKIVGKENLHIVMADALKYNVLDIPAPRVIVANLPYNISTKLLLQWLPVLPQIKEMVLMFQKEVAMRIVADHGSKQYGRLSVMSGYRANIEHLFDLPPDAFTPAPKVTSSVIRIVYDASKDTNIDWHTLEYIATKAFSMRRKKLRSCFKSDEELLAKAQMINMDLDKRAEDIPVEQYCQLAKHYQYEPKATKV